MKNKNSKIFKKFKNIFLKRVVVATAFFCLTPLVLNLSFGEMFALPEAFAAECAQSVDVIIVIDSSGSMNDNGKMEMTKTAAKNFVDKLNLSAALPAGDQAGLVSFSNDAILQNTLTQDAIIIKDRIDVLIAGGQTNLKEAIEKARIELISSRHNASANKIMVILSDGKPTRPSPDSFAGQEARNAANNAKNNFGIRIITTGLDLQNLSEEERAAATAVLTDVATAPTDFYQTTEAATLDIIYNTISQSLCDMIPPALLSISRNPSGTVYAADTITIKSVASDNFGIKSHFIKWTKDNWATTNVSANGDCDVLRNNCALTIGPFLSGDNIKYKIEAADSNNNSISSFEYSFGIANLSISASGLLRNTLNTVTASVNDPDGKMILENAKFYISVESPDGGGVYKLNKAEMACAGNEFNRNCVYAVNPLCDWLDSTAKIYIYPYDNNYEAGYHNPPAVKSTTIANPIESITEAGRCANCLNDDCDAAGKWDLANYNNTGAGCGSIAVYDANFAESACDGLAPVLAISRSPAGIVFETDNLILTSVAAEMPSGLNILQNHRIWYRINEGSWTKAFECLDVSPVDGLCDADVSKNISNFSVNLGQYASGTKIDYYSEAIDTAPIPNTGRSSPTFDTAIIAYADCYNADGTQKPALTVCGAGGKCCAEICNSPTSFAGNCLLDDECRQEICSGAVWTCAPANTGNNCSAFGGDSDGCFSYLTGCEERNYSCQTNGSCGYSAPSNRNIDGCSAGLFADFGCSENSCGAISSADCALPGTVAGCACSCGGYGKEEKFYGSLNLDGADDYVKINNVPVNTVSNAQNTVEFWMKWNGGDNQMPFGWNSGYDLWLVGGCFGFNTNENNVFGFSSAGLANNWVHVAAVFNNGVPSVSSSKIYINGIEKTLTNCRGATTLNRIATSTVFISGYNSSASYKFNGSIDEVRIYNRALSLQEISQHYNGEYLNETGLAGLWHLDGNANDASGNNNNGTLSLGSSGNTSVSNAWLTARVDPGNVPAIWRICSDTDSNGNPIDNDCDGAANIAEPACDNVFDSLVAGPPGTVYNDLNVVSIVSTAVDSAGISQHMVKWWIGNNEATAIGKSCPSLNNCQLDIIAPYAPFAAGTIIRYRSEATDNMGNGKTVAGEFTVTSRECVDEIGNIVPDGTPCGYGPGTCFDWVYGTGCEQRNDMCFVGVCQSGAFDQKEDRCGDYFGNDKNILREYGCLGNSCAAGTATDCSQAGSVNGCACVCNGFGKEEKFYSALKLDGQDDYVNAGNNLRLNVATGDFSVEVWAKSFGYTSAGTIISKQNWFYSGGPGYYIAYPYSPQNIYVGVCDGSNCSVNYHHIKTGLGSVFDWTHIIMVKEGYRLKAYINGARVNTGGSNTDNIIGSLSNAQNLFIGKSASGGFFNGLIKGVRFYDRALSDLEAQNHFKGIYLNDNNAAGPAAIWDLDGNTNDNSGNGNNATLSLGSSGNTTLVNAWVSNKTDSNNIPLSWLVCTDKNDDNSDKDNNCNGIANSQEIGCDNFPPVLTVSHNSVSGNDYYNEIITLSSTASDDFGLNPGSHKILWTKDNWISSSTSALSDCAAGNCVVNFPAETFSPSTVIKYKAEAADNNGNFNVSPEQEFTVRDECFGSASGSSCAGGNGICCGNFCDKMHWRKSVTITGSTGGSVMDYQVKVAVAKEAKMKSDFSDVYFTDSDGVNMLSFWRESYDGSAAVFWVKVPSIPAAPGTKIIYMYYGSPIVNTASNLTNTFNANLIYAAEGACTNSTNCAYIDNHSEANAVRNYPSNIGSSYVNKIYWGSVFDNSATSSGVRNNFYSRFRFLFVPSIGGVWNFAVDSDDSGELIINPQDKDAPSGETVLATWYGGHGWCNCQTHGGSIDLTANQGVWLDYLQEEWSGGEAAVLWARKPGGGWLNLSAANFSSQIYSRKYISPEPIIAIGAEISTGPTDYLLDSECSELSCSAAIPTIWTWTAKNNGASCADGVNGSGCYIWPAPGGNGCETRTYACNNGNCLSSSSGQMIDGCSGNVFNDYGCGAFCGVATAYNCSQTGNIAAVYDNPALACNCKCGNHDLEEKFYQSLKFDGVDDYVSAGSGESLNFSDTQAFSIEVWFKTTQTARGDLVSRVDNLLSPYPGYLLSIGRTTAGKLDFYLGNGGQAKTNIGSNLNDGNWHQAVAVAAGMNNIYFYVDGLQLVDNETLTQATNLGGMNLTIGRTSSAALNYFNGSIDEVRIYNRALPPQEVSRHYNGEYSNETGMVGLWHLDGNTNDASGNNNNGILYLGANGNTSVSNAWASERLDANNVPAPRKVCSDGKNNDCDALNKIDAAELACDNMAPNLSLEVKDKDGNIIANGASIYDINIDSPSEKISFNSLSSDNFSIIDHKLFWTTDNWTNSNVVDCLADNCFPYRIAGGTFSTMPVTIKYYAEAWDNNGNSVCFPVGCRSFPDYFSVIPFNTAPVTDSLAITQAGDYCVTGPNITVEWNYSDGEDDAQAAYQVEIDDSSDFSSPIHASPIVNSASTSYSLSSGLAYATSYYWRVKVWDARGMVSQGSGGVCGDWKCVFGQSTATPAHQYPSVDFDWTPVNPKVSDEIHFNNVSTPNTDVAWEWDLNSPSDKCGLPEYRVTAANRDNTVDWNPVYIYSEPVNYAIGLKITDSDNYSCEIQKCISIGKKAPKWKEIIPK